MRKLQLIILILISNLILYSQTVDNDSLKIIKSQIDPVYKEINTNKIEISWSSIRINGRYVLVITPRQIYLKSSHDNPNPNYLYWMASISEKQFSQIKAYLETQNENKLHNYTFKESTCLSYYFNRAKIEKYKSNKWTNECYYNFQKLINIINKPLREKIGIPTKSDFDKIKILKFEYNTFEL